MLVCHVIQRPPSRVIEAGLTEAVAAADAAATGNVIFATLVDDPASVRDRVDAYLGEIMLETASASATVNAGLVYAAAVVEPAAAAESVTGAVPGIFAADVAEAATAVSDQDATIVGAAVRSAMLPTVFVNSGTSREANVNGIMVNL